MQDLLAAKALYDEQRPKDVEEAKRILRHGGYPPELQEVAAQTVLQQAVVGGVRNFAGFGCEGRGQVALM